MRAERRAMIRSVGSWLPMRKSRDRSDDPGVLIIVQNLPVPFDRRVWVEATTLQRAGFQVSVICPKLKNLNGSYECLEGVHIHRYRLPIDARGPFGFMVEFSWCFLRTLMKSIRVAVRGPGFDVIHACNPPETYWILALFWRAMGKRFLFDHHDLSPEMYEAKFQKGRGVLYRGLLFLERMTFRTADIVITTNESHKRIAMERGGKRAEDVYIVRSGPDLTRLQLRPPNATWRNGAQHLLVYLGEICRQDGVEYLVRAIKLLRDEWGRSDFHCLFVGGGPHEASIRAYAAELEVMQSCTFLGNVSDDGLLSCILSSADVGIVPDPKTAYSDMSTMNKVVEYMHFGIPIVGFDLRENRFSAGAAAVYARPNEERDLARKISDLLDDPSRRQTMSAIGKRRVREELAWCYSAPHLLAAYQRVLGERLLRLGRRAA
jgi:glycosyltransferase involved in cell wall biosynthesis